MSTKSDQRRSVAEFLPTKLTNIQFVMYGLNINNEVFGFYNGSPQYMLQREYYRPTIAAGFRWTPLHER